MAPLRGGKVLDGANGWHLPASFAEAQTVDLGAAVPLGPVLQTPLDQRLRGKTASSASVIPPSEGESWSLMDSPSRRRPDPWPGVLLV